MHQSLGTSSKHAAANPRLRGGSCSSSSSAGTQVAAAPPTAVACDSGPPRHVADRAEAATSAWSAGLQMQQTSQGMHSLSGPRQFAEGSGVSGAEASVVLRQLLAPSYGPFRQGEVGWMADPADQPVRQVSPPLMEHRVPEPAPATRLEQLLQLAHENLRKVQEERDQLMQGQKRWNAQQIQHAMDMAAKEQQLQDAMDRAGREQRARVVAEMQVQQLQHALASRHGQLPVEQRGQLEEQLESLAKELRLKAADIVVCAPACSSILEMQQQQWGCEAVNTLSGGETRRWQQQDGEHAAAAPSPLGNLAAAHGPCYPQQDNVAATAAVWVGAVGSLPDQLQQGRLVAAAAGLGASPLGSNLDQLQQEKLVAAAAALPIQMPPDVSAAAWPATGSKRQRTEAALDGAVGDAHAAEDESLPWWYFDVDVDLGLSLSACLSGGLSLCLLR